MHKKIYSRFPCFASGAKRARVGIRVRSSDSRPYSVSNIIFLSKFHDK